VDAKNWSSRVEVKDGVLRAGGYRKSRECEAVASGAAAVAALLEPQHHAIVIGAVCLVQQDAAPSVADGVTVVGRSGIARWLLFGSVVLSPAEVAAIAGYLHRVLSGPTSPAQLTTGHVLTAKGGGRVEPSARARRGRAPRPAVRATRRPPRRHSGGGLSWNVIKLVVALTVIWMSLSWLSQVAGGLRRRRPLRA
jgi:hypothetical protein